MAKKEDGEGPAHPGPHVRQNVIPEGMTVTKAAELLGVGRPALSNFLNGKAALSPELALRLERAFGADRNALLDMQAEVSRPKQASRRPVVTGTHAPTLVEIKAKDIVRWAGEKNARDELAALLRQLVHSTGHDLTHVDFPAFDNAERPGWDGEVEAGTPTPWIPDGKSCWEFGCNAQPKRKAAGDYTNRTKSVPAAERRNTTFVFVTPRKWPSKKKWAEEKADRGEWKDVRAYDASDLEQWIEQSPKVQVWFAERLGWPTEGYRSLEKCWADWADACDPRLSEKLFAPAVEEWRERFAQWLDRPPESPFIIAADSRGEALAFLHCLVGEPGSGTGPAQAGAIVFDTPEAMRRLDANGGAGQLAVFPGPETQREIGGLHRRCHCVFIRPRNDVHAEPDIRLGLLGWEDFSAALRAMGLSDGEIDRRARESARSPTVLQRRLSANPAGRTPEWAEDRDTARKLLPAAFVGAWHNATAADREVVRLLAGANDDSDIEKNVTELAAQEDPPVWSAGEYRGVVSRIDALFAVAPFVIEADLKDFLLVAEYVLSERDPAIDLPEDEQWLANLHGKVRNHSGALRRGIRETLILLAVFGDGIFSERLGFDAEARVAALVRKLLTPLDGEKLLSQNDNLPDYAEAAPGEFLSLIEADLRQEYPIMQELLRPASGVLSGGPMRTNLLWALEGIAWDPQYFPRVVDILARLCGLARKGSEDNWANKPENTLHSVFRSWMPQTAAPLNMRIKVFEKMCRNYRDIGWSACMQHMDLGPDGASPNYRFHWRGDASIGDGRPTQRERMDFIRKAADIALSWPEHNEKTLSDLVSKIEILVEEDQSGVLESIEQWIETKPTDEAKDYLLQRIRYLTYIRHLRKKSVSFPDRERKIQERLVPQDLILRHAWLFTSDWIDLPPEDGDEVETDYERNETRLQELRRSAIREIWTNLGFAGIDGLLQRGGSGPLAGELMAEILNGRRKQRLEFARFCIRAASGQSDSPFRSCLAGFLWKARNGFVTALAEDIGRANDRKDLLILFLALPAGKAAWRMLDSQTDALRMEYWRAVEPMFFRDGQEDELNEAIDRLLDAGRPGAAFQSARLRWKGVETSRIRKILGALIKADPDDYIRNNHFGYDLSEGFSNLDQRPDVPVEEKARLEFAYIPFLVRSRHGIPNFEREICRSPEIYAEAISYMYKRADGKEETGEPNMFGPMSSKQTANHIFELLNSISRLPGTGEDGTIDAKRLREWITQVRDWCKKHSRADVGDIQIGQLLARAGGEEGETWPSRPVCEALECVASEEIGRGFCTGTLNRRGVYSRVPGEDGEQERDLAARYRGWADALRHEFPYVGGLLDEIAVSYDHYAGWQDNRAEVGRRLPGM